MRLRVPKHVEQLRQSSGDVVKNLDTFGVSELRKKTLLLENVTPISSSSESLFRKASISSCGSSSRVKLNGDTERMKEIETVVISEETLSNYSLSAVEDNIEENKAIFRSTGPHTYKKF